MLVAYELKMHYKEVEKFTPTELASWLAFIKVKGEREKAQMTRNKSKKRGPQY